MAVASEQRSTEVGNAWLRVVLYQLCSVNEMQKLIYRYLSILLLTGSFIYYKYKCLKHIFEQKNVYE